MSVIKSRPEAEGFVISGEYFSTNDFSSRYLDGIVEDIPHP